MGCSDFGARSIPETPLCIMPEESRFHGVITDVNGRVVDVVSADEHSADLATPYMVHHTERRTEITDEAISATRDMAGVSFIDCHARTDSMGVSYSPLPSSYEGEPISWSVEDYRALTSALPGSGMAFFCSNRENPSTVVLGSDSFHREALYSAADRFSAGECGTMDDLHCGAALRSLHVALGHPASGEATGSHSLEVAGGLFIGLIFLGVTIAGHIFGHRYNMRADRLDAAAESEFSAQRAERFAREIDTPEAREWARISREAAHDAAAARDAGRPREAARLYERARLAADELERVATARRIERARRGGPDDRDPPDGPGGGTPAATATEVDVVSSADPGLAPGSGEGATRTALPDMARGILALHGDRTLDPSAEGVRVLLPETGGSPSVPGVLPVPVLTNPVAAPEPILAPRPVITPRLVPAL